MNKVFGGSGISEECYNWIVAHTPIGAPVVEIGGGEVSTQYLSLLYDLHTIEQNEKYIGKYQATYIHARIVDGEWYDRAAIVGKIPSDARTILVDGPSCGGRSGLLDNIDLFPIDCKWVFHDTHRDGERTLALQFAELIGRPVVFHNPDFGVIE